jgi:exosome complex component RRP42
MVLIVFLDIYVLNFDGNLIDASTIAALAALLNTKLPNYEIEKDEIKRKTGYTQLPIANHPIAITVAKIGDKLLVDPTVDEEEVMDARITIGFDDKENIVAVQKGESGSFTLELILEAVKLAQENVEKLRKIVVDG